MAKKKTPKKKTPVKKKSPPINWLRDWEEFDFSDASGPGEIATRQARVEQIVVEFLSRQNTASYPKNWHFIVRDFWTNTGTDYSYSVFLRPPVKDNGGGTGTVDPPAPTQPPPPNLS